MLSKNDFLFTIQNETFSWFMVARLVLDRKYIHVFYQNTYRTFEFEDDKKAETYYNSITLG